MKKINWKILIITILITLSPCILGVIYYKELPENMAVHFNIENKPDRYASKNFALFVIPTFMTLLQIICCTISDLRGNEGKTPKVIYIIKWFIPILSIAVSVMTIQFSLGNNVDIGKWVCLILGILFILMGNYLPKLSYENAKGKINSLPKDEKRFRKMIRVFGYTFVIGGFVMLFSILLKSIYSFVIILLICVIVIIESIYYTVKK